MRFKPPRLLALLSTAGLGALVAAALLLPPVVPAALAPEEQQGAALTESLRSRDQQCAEFSADDLGSIGEFAMGRYLGDTAAHARMNRRMVSMMGVAGSRRMHLALGRRYSGCGSTSDSSWLAPMTGMMGGEYPGSMMAAGRHHGDTDIEALDVILIALAAAALGGGIAALALHRRRPGRSAAP